MVLRLDSGWDDRHITPLTSFSQKETASSSRIRRFFFCTILRRRRRRPHASMIGSFQEKPIAANGKLTAAHLLQWKLSLSPAAKRVRCIFTGRANCTHGCPMEWESGWRSRVRLCLWSRWTAHANRARISPRSFWNIICGRNGKQVSALRVLCRTF